MRESNFKSAYTLVELIISMALVPMIIILSTTLLMVISKTEIKTIRQIRILKLQLLQTFNRASHLEFENSLIRYTWNSTDFVIECDSDRLVRRPGYEILLEKVSKFEIKDESIEICDEVECIVIE